MKAVKMLTRASGESAVDARKMALPAPARSKKLVRDAVKPRIAVLAMCIFAMSNLTRAQDTTVSAVGIRGGELDTVSPEEKYAALEKENMDLVERVLELENANRDLEARALQLRQTVMVANSAGKKLSSSLARRISRNASRNVSAMAGTSIPYIGVGVLVAMAELDVKDGCDGLKELNEMNRAMGLDREDESRVCAMQVPAKEDVIAQVIHNWRTAYGNAAAWANQYEARLPPDPPAVSYPHAGELWMAVFGAHPKPAFQTLPTLPISPTPPILPASPVPPTIKRSFN
jgi:hypothetical protein